jgi:hypothetical protein
MMAGADYLLGTYQLCDKDLKVCWYSEVVSGNATGPGGCEQNFRAGKQTEGSAQSPCKILPYR